MASGPWEPLTPKTVTEPKVLLERLRKVKNQGYAANESEYIAGVVGAAVPIQNANGSRGGAHDLCAKKQAHAGGRRGDGADTDDIRGSNQAGDPAQVRSRRRQAAAFKLQL